MAIVSKGTGVKASDGNMEEVGFESQLSSMDYSSIIRMTAKQSSKLSDKNLITGLGMASPVKSSLFVEKQPTATQLLLDQITSSTDDSNFLAMVNDIVEQEKRKDEEKRRRSAGCCSCLTWRTVKTKSHPSTELL